MKEHPILFSEMMVRAILDGRKTQTRRVMKSQPFKWAAHIVQSPCDKLPGFGKPGTHLQASEDFYRACGLGCAPVCQSGDRLWVRETFIPKASGTIYAADFESVEAAGLSGMYGGWKPSIHMPRAASRITLEVTSVRVQRLQEISEEDAKSEGVGESIPDNWIKSETPNKALFSGLWDSIYGKTAPWSSNCWVWVYNFKRIK